MGLSGNSTNWPNGVGQKMSFLGAHQIGSVDPQTHYCEFYYNKFDSYDYKNLYYHKIL